MADRKKAGRLEELLEAGKKNGYVLYDDIDALLPADYESGPELDDVLAAVQRAGIEVVIRTDGDVVDEPEIVEEMGADIYTDDPVGVYVHEVGRLPRLTRAAEIELAKVVGLADASAERAKKDLVEANLMQVVVIARQYANRGVHILELIQKGNNGLMKAAESFDCIRGYRFSVYAGWLARRFVIRAMRQSGGKAIVPPHLKPPFWIQ